MGVDWAPIARRLPLDSSTTVLMDAHTLELLEFGKLKELLAGYASSLLGKERARALAPMTDLELVREAIARTTETAEAIAGGLTPPLQGLQDVRLWARRASFGVLLEIEPLRQIRDVAVLTGRVHDYWSRLGPDYETLGRMLSNVRDLRHVAHEIDAVIDERGVVRDGASAELGRIRRQLAAFDERIQIELRRLLRSPEIKKALRYPQATLSGDHHVLPVAVNHRHKVEGVVHRASSTGETVYIEPTKVARIAIERSVVKSAEAREVRKVLRRLTTVVGEVGEPLLESLDVLAELDLTCAKARYAAEYDMTPPAVAADGPLSFHRARHPLLERLFRQPSAARTPRSESDKAPESEPRTVVPIDVTLGDSFDLIVVTGPNTGGKTVALKTIGLLSVMAQCGLHVSARSGSRVPLLRNVLADIGDEQSLEQSLSTFSSHISRIASILNEAGPRTLVLLDELGSGTEPSEGAALGRAILDELVAKGCPAMVTTHLGDLKTVAFSAERVENAAMLFDAETLRPTYQLVVGQYGQSCALKIARRLELPAHLIERAGEYLHRRRGTAGPELDRLQEMRHEALRAREQADDAQSQARQAEEEFRRKTDLLHQEAEISAELEKARASLMPGDVVRVARFDKQGTVVRIDHRRGLAAVTVGAVEWELPLDELVPGMRT